MTDEEKLLLHINAHRTAVRSDLPRNLLVDFIDRVKVAAAQSKRTVVKSELPTVDEIRLAPQRANKVAGLIRHEYVDEVFTEIASRHHGERVGSVEVPSRDKPKSKSLYLSTFRFGGTLLGFGSHFQREDLPRLNKTRKALCALNEGLLPDLFRRVQNFSESERFAVLMLQRSHTDIGVYSSMSIGLIDNRGTQWVFRDELSDFLAGYGAAEEREGRRTIRLKERTRRIAVK
ncbi:MAG: hypothetical protein ABL311_04730 [Nitratireductor rhodophyticola]|uniref:hypothetical protein n=1 Tax=Nitratireductor rhodophyticola TaxID=2854036 RepID=UPI0032D8BB92